MFLHHTMTDAEILRTCEGCTSPHLRLVADRLRQRVEDLQTIANLASVASTSLALDALLEAIVEIEDLAKGE